MRNNYSESQKGHLRDSGVRFNQGIRGTDQQWNFKNVNSVYELAQEPLNHQQQPHIYRQPYQYIQSQKPYQYSQQSNPKQLKFNSNPLPCQYTNQITAQRLNSNNNPSLKSNSQTNVISQSQSLEYLSSQQPSFSNKGEFTICEDFNVQPISPVKHQRYCYNQPDARRQDNWAVASFSDKQQHHYFRDSNNRSLKVMYEKCTKAYQQIHQLKFMKQGLESRLKQQKITFTNQLQQLKKVLFKLNIMYEKDILQFQKQSKQEARSGSMRQSSMRQSSVKDSDGIANQVAELKKYCKQLQEEKNKAEQKYQLTLKKYQQEIQMISEQFQKKLALQKSSHLPGFGYNHEKCANCINFDIQLKENINRQTYEIQIWKTRLQEQQQNHAKAMKRLQQKVHSIQQQFSILEQSKTQLQKSIKQRQKQIVYREAELQYRFKDIDRRQKDLEIAESLLQKQRDELERKKDKIADYELKVLKQERSKKNEIKQKQIMTSEYFNNNEKKRILGKSNQDRSDSTSSKGSRIDINARLKQIQMMRNRTSRIYDQNATSRNSSKDSRSSGYRDYGGSRVSLTGKNATDYGIVPSISGTPKQGVRGNSQSIKLSEKLNKLTETLQKELRQMD